MAPEDPVDAQGQTDDENNDQETAEGPSHRITHPSRTSYRSSPGYLTRRLSGPGPSSTCKASLLVDPLHLGLDVSPESIDQRSLVRTRYSPFTLRTIVRPRRSAAKSSSHDKLDNLVDHTALPTRDRQRLLADHGSDGSQTLQLRRIAPGRLPVRRQPGCPVGWYTRGVRRLGCVGRRAEARASASAQRLERGRGRDRLSHH